MPRKRKQVILNSKAVQANCQNEFSINNNFFGSNYYNDTEIIKKIKLKLFCNIEDLIKFSKKLDKLPKLNIKQNFKSEKIYSCFDSHNTNIIANTTAQSTQNQCKITKNYLCQLHNTDKKLIVSLTNVHSIKLKENNLKEKKKILSSIFLKYFYFRTKNKIIKVGQELNSNKNLFFIEFQKQYTLDSNAMEFAINLLQDLFDTKVILKEIN